MQWQRVLHGFGNAIENVAQIHSVYEFTLKEVPGQLIRIRVLETPVATFYAIPDHLVAYGDNPPQPLPMMEPEISPAKALQEAVRRLLDQIRPPYDQIRLVRLQCW